MWKKVILDAWNGTSDQERDADTANDYDFEGMKKLVKEKDPSLILLDVREPKEFETYSIPGSVNMPFRSHPEGLSLDEKEFQQTFGFPKPGKQDRLVIFCASGRRAASAEGVALKAKYTNVALYPGSVNDWLAKGGDKLDL